MRGALKTFGGIFKKPRSGYPAHARGLSHNAAVRFSKTLHYVGVGVFVKQPKTDRNINHGQINPC